MDWVKVMRRLVLLGVTLMTGALLVSALAGPARAREASQTVPTATSGTAPTATPGTGPTVVPTKAVTLATVSPITTATATSPCPKTGTNGISIGTSKPCTFGPNRVPVTGAGGTYGKSFGPNGLPQTGGAQPGRRDVVPYLLVALALLGAGMAVGLLPKRTRPRP